MEYRCKNVIPLNNLKKTDYSAVTHDRHFTDGYFSVLLKNGNREVPLFVSNFNKTSIVDSIYLDETLYQECQFSHIEQFYNSELKITRKELECFKHTVKCGRSLLYYYIDTNHKKKEILDVLAIPYDGETYIYLNRKYVDIIVSRFPNYRVYRRDPFTAVVFKDAETEELVGLVMPILK